MSHFVKVIITAGLCLVCLGWGTARAEPASGAADTLYATLTTPDGPGPAMVQAGDTLTVRIEIPVAGPPFNAFDAFVRFDPEILTFLPAALQQAQVGTLMSDACPQSFHLFSQAPDSMTLEINFSLLCANVTVTGPGVVYEVRFQCRDVDAYTRLEFLTEPGRITRFYDDGYFVQPLVLSPLLVQTGEGAAPVPPAAATEIILRAAPNPFNPRTVFTFNQPQAGYAELSVYDVRGRLVRSLQAGLLDAGDQRITWNGRDDAGLPVEAGVYLGLVRTPGGTGRTALTILK